jgi:acyl-CoA thioester hydrolase
MAALLETYRTAVLPEWIDYNGHMNVAYYVLVFDRGTDGLLDHLGLGAAYRRATDNTLYALEAHVSYLREVREGDPLVITTQLIAGDAKRLHFFHFMHHAEAGFLAATSELMTLHVDLAGPRAAPIPAAEAARVAALLEEHRHLPAPPQLGRAIGLRK